MSGAKVDKVVFDYKPREFPTEVQEVAKDFSVNRHVSVSNSGFRINPLIAERTGISQLQAESLERAVEAQALERLKEIQENAYREAFDLGLSEGTQKAFEEHKEEFAARLSYLDSLMKAFENLKSRLLSENESQMITLIFDVAQRIALKEIKENPQMILEIIRQVVESSQTDEKLRIKISPEDFEFIESLSAATPREKEVLDKVRLEADPQVTSGGCLLETNYGSIDASIEQRVEKAWQILSERKPKIQASDMGIETTKNDDTNDESGEKK